MRRRDNEGILSIMADAFRDGFNIFRRLLAQALGVVLVVLGIIGIPTPIINGIIPLAIGLTLLAMYNPPLHRYVHALVRRFPKLAGAFEKVEMFFERIFGPSPNGITIRSGFTHPENQTSAHDASQDLMIGKEKEGDAS